MQLRHIILFGTIVEALFLAVYLSPHSAESVLWFIAMQGITFIVYAYVVLQIKSGKLSSTWPSVWAIVAFAVVFRLSLVPHSPIASDDIYRYVWDGKVAFHGINPFAFAPNDPTLEGLRTDDLPSKINFPYMRTIYPPLAQMFFYCSNVLFGDSIWGMKLLLVLLDIASIGVILLLLRLHGQNPALVALYAWSPLPIMYFGLDGHIDALGIPLLLLTIYLVKRNKHFASAVSLGLSVAAKLYPLMIAPSLARIRKDGKRIFLPAIPVVILAIGCWAYLEPTGGLGESLKVFNTEFEFNGAVFSLLYIILRSNTSAHIVSGILLFGWLLWVWSTKREFSDVAFLAFLGFVLFSPVVHPWYLTWIAALLVLRWSLAVFVFLGLSNLSNIVVYEYRSTGVWSNQPLLLLVEYLPFFVLLSWEVLRGRFSTLPDMTSIHR